MCKIITLKIFIRELPNESDSRAKSALSGNVINKARVIINEHGLEVSPYIVGSSRRISEEEREHTVEMLENEQVITNIFRDNRREAVDY